MRMMLVDDDDDVLSVTKQILVEILGHDVTACENAEKALETYREEPFPIVITDVCMPGRSGFDLLNDIKALPSGENTEVILVTGYADLESAVRALREGAFDFLQKPIKAAGLIEVINRAVNQQAVLASGGNHLKQQSPRRVPQNREPIEEKELQRACIKFPDGSNIGVFSKAMRAIRESSIRFHKDRSVPVLVEGETGTGKEQIAKLVHYGTDSDASLPFISVNCAAISESLFESELFGYVGGAFTGALRTGMKGKLEAANGGTIFLDEVGEIPMNMQPKLLRALQEKVIYRVGGTDPVELDVRVIAATNRDLAEMVEENTFRRDLFYRLNVVSINIPPLRKQPSSIAPLAQVFLKEFASGKDRRFEYIGNDAVEVLEGHPWPGNIRELRNAIEHAVLLHDDVELRTEHLGSVHAAAYSYVAKDSEALRPGKIRLPEDQLNIEELNREIVSKALEKFDGHKAKTAEYLGLTRSALRSRLTKLD